MCWHKHAMLAWYTFCYCVHRCISLEHVMGIVSISVGTSVGKTTLVPRLPIELRKAYLYSSWMVSHTDASIPMPTYMYSCIGPMMRLTIKGSWRWRHIVFRFLKGWILLWCGACEVEQVKEILFLSMDLDIGLEWFQRVLIYNNQDKIQINARVEHISQMQDSIHKDLDNTEDSFSLNNKQSGKK